MKKYFIIGGAAIALLLATVAFSTPIFIKFSGSDTIYKAYQTAEQFFADGGAKDFSNVAIIDEPQLGSVAMANEYNATTTGAAGDYLASANPNLIKTGQGTLGSVVVLKAGTAGGVFGLYNATTTDRTKRNNISTSSIVIAKLPTDLAAGTYTFDVFFTNGLIIDWVGTMGTSTITFR